MEQNPVNIPPHTSPEPNGVPSWKERLERYRLFLLTVALPTLLAIIYFGLIASDVYVSESRFILNTPDQKPISSSLGMLLSKYTSFSRANDDSFSVHDYILSRDVLKSLDGRLHLRQAFSQASIDPFNRFVGAAWWKDSFEDFHEYYRNHIVKIEIGVASITTLTVRAFSAEDAFRINQALQEKSEQFINMLNERARQDLIRFAAGEVATAEQTAKSTALALANFRNQKNVINPEQQSLIQLQQIAKLQDELIATQAQLSQVQSLTTHNPQTPTLQLRVANLRKEIENETNRVAGGTRSLADKVAEYQRLALDRDLADKQLASAMESLAQARNEALRQQLYLERIVPPNTPDRAMEPHRIRGICTTFVLGLLAWGILAMLLAGIREHQD